MGLILSEVLLLQGSLRLGMFLECLDIVRVVIDYSVYLAALDRFLSLIIVVSSLTS
jgi:hypothetical protein